MKKFKKLHKLVLMSSLAAILAGGVAISSTYALFTSKDETKVTVSAGKVEIKATVTKLQTYSGVDLTGNPDEDKISETKENLVFTNSGTVSYDDKTGRLTLENMTPGDRVSFTIDITNLSNVLIKYRSVLKLDETTSSELFKALKVTFNGEEFKGSETISHWTKLEASTNPKSIDVVIELPSDAKNEYQGKSCTIINTIEAVQGNAGVYDVEVSSNDDLLSALNSSVNSTSIKLASNSNIALSERYDIKTKDLTIYGDGNTKIESSDKRVFNIYGSNDSDGDFSYMNGGSLTISGVNLKTTGFESNETRGINMYGLSKFDLNINDSTIETLGYGINVYNCCKDVTVTVNDSTITGYAPFQTWSPDTKAVFTNCTLKGVNDFGKGNNDYSTIVIYKDAINTDLTFVGCTITAYAGENSSEEILNFRNKESHVTFDSCEFWYKGKSDNELAKITDKFKDYVEKDGYGYQYTYAYFSSNVSDGVLPEHVTIK